LGAEEPPRFLLYSPLRETTAGPFGIRGRSGSHALAFTDSRVIVSRDPHSSGAARSVRVLPYEEILSVEIGEALTLGWLVLRFAAGGAVGSETIFFQSTGIALFRTAVRICRRRGTSTGVLPAAAGEEHPVLAQAPPYLRSQVLPILLDDEQPRTVVRSVHRWRSASARPACTIPERLYAVTEHGLIVAESERPHRPGALVFGVNVICIDRCVMRGVSVSAEPDADTATFVVDLRCSGSSHQLTYSLDMVCADTLTESIVRGWA
jgi:hypothetical protein